MLATIRRRTSPCRTRSAAVLALAIACRSPRSRRLRFVTLARLVVRRALLADAVAGAAQPALDQQAGARRARADAADRATQLRDLRHALTRLPIAAGLACVLALRPRRTRHAASAGAGHPDADHPGRRRRRRDAGRRRRASRARSASSAPPGWCAIARRSTIPRMRASCCRRWRSAWRPASGSGCSRCSRPCSSWRCCGSSSRSSRRPRSSFTLKVKAKDPAALKPKLEQLLARYRLEFELRATSQEELHYEVRVPLEQQDRSALGRDPEARSGQRRPRSSGRRRKRRSKKS